MARQNHGPLSRAKGKLGGVVFQQYEGMQISREYQPNVKNPQSTKQVENRAKFKLSSQLVAQFSEIFNTRLAKLSIYTRTRRAASVNAIYNVITTTNPSTPQALVSAVVSAVNAKSATTLAAPAIVEGGTNVANVTAPSGQNVTIVTAIYDKNTGKIISRSVENFTSSGFAKEVTIDSSNRSVVMAVATKANTEAGRATISNVDSIDDGWKNVIIRGVAEGDLDVTNLAGVCFNPF